MAYNNGIADRITEFFFEKEIQFREKKMFGGIAFFINDKMCAGVIKEDLMIRVMDERYPDLVEENYARPMDFTGRELNGYILVEMEGIKTKKAIEKWLEFSVEFGKHGILRSKKKNPIKNK